MSTSTETKVDKNKEPRGIEDERYVLFPLKHPETFRLYKKHLASFWTAEEVDLADDIKHWKRLSENEQKFITHVLAFFAASDGIVLENLAVRFMNDLPIAEVRCFYGFQIMMENVHSETYSILIDTLVKDRVQKNKAFKAIQTYPAIREKAQWALKWIGSNSSFEERLLAFLCVEGIFFSGSFCAIFWLKKRGLMPGLCFSNELISRDEGLHCEFAKHVYKNFRRKDVDQAVVHSIFSEAVAVEKKFICESLPCALLGMNNKLMRQYIEFVADHWLIQLGFETLYGAQNPFDFMQMISLQGKTNFFEKRVGEYAKSGVMSSSLMMSGSTNKKQANQNHDENDETGGSATWFSLEEQF